jgi:hypothetical protein
MKSGRTYKYHKNTTSTAQNKESARRRRVAQKLQNRASGETPRVRRMSAAPVPRTAAGAAAAVAAAVVAATAVASGYRYMIINAM